MFSKNRKTLLLSLFFIVFYSAAITSSAQSGRARPRPEPSRPSAPQPDQKKPESAERPGRILVPAGAAIVSEEHTGVTSRYVFKNGITLVVREDHSLPIAASIVYVKAGTANEPEGQAGVARVVARLLAESHSTASEDLLHALHSQGGTESNKPDFAAYFLGPPSKLREMRQQGGILRSKTDFDATAYYLLGPSSKFAKLLELQFGSLQRRSFGADEVARAARLVAQADRLKLDDPLGYGEQRVLQAAFGASPGAEAVTNDEPKLIGKEQAQAFYELYYQPNNIIVAVAGDVSADQVRLAAQQFLGGMRSGAAQSKAPASAAAPQTQTQVRYLEERADINQTIVSVGYRAPGLKEKESATFEVLSALLTRGRGALLPQALTERSSASRVAAEYVASNKGGLFVFQMQVAPERLVKAEETLFDQIENMRRVIISPGELQRAKSLLEKQYYDRTMSVGELAGQLAFWEARGGYKNFDNYLQRIKAVTGEQIQQLAEQYFGFNTAVVHEYEPRNAPPRIPGTDPNYSPERYEAFINVLVPRTHKETIAKDEIVYAPETPLAKQGRERHEQTMEAGFILELQPQPTRDFSTLRGPRAFVREDQSRPLLAVGIYFQGGRLLENETNSGITELMLRTMLNGTQQQSGAELALKLEQLGAEVKVVNEPDFFGYTLEVLSRNSEQTLKTLIDIIETAAFDKAVFAQEKASLLAAARAMRDDSRHRPIELFHNALYGSHPYGLPQLGLESAIERLTESDISGWYQRFVKRQLPLVVIVGDTEGSALVGRFIAEGFSRRDMDKSLTVPTVSASATEKVEQRERRQTAQVLGFSGPEGKSGDSYAVEVIRRIVDGPGGRFLSNLQQQELGFDLSVETEQRMQQSSFLVYINSLPEQELQARALVKEEFRRLASAPPSDEEVEAGRNCAIAATLDSLHAHGARAIAYARNYFFGLPVADIDNLPEKLGGVNKESVRKVLQAYFLPDRLAVGVLRASPPAITQGASPSAVNR